MNSLFEYKIKDNKVHITNYLGKDKHIVIPEEINGIPVIGIDDYALIEKNIYSIDLGKVRYLGNYALAYNYISKIYLLNIVEFGVCVFDSNVLDLILIPKYLCSYDNMIKDIFDMTKDEIDRMNNKYVKNYVCEKRKENFKKLYKNSSIADLICHNIVEYMYKDSYEELMLEIIELES
jgi:hypothetical protein